MRSFFFLNKVGTILAGGQEACAQFDSLFRDPLFKMSFTTASSSPVIWTTSSRTVTFEKCYWSVCVTVGKCVCPLLYDRQSYYLICTSYLRNLCCEKADILYTTLKSDGIKMLNKFILSLQICIHLVITFGLQEIKKNSFSLFFYNFFLNYILIATIFISK